MMEKFKKRSTKSTPLFRDTNKHSVLDIRRVLLISGIALCVAFIVAAFIMKFVSASDQKLDKDLCICGVNPTANTVVILDLTDGLLNYQIEAFKEEIGYYVKELPPNGKLSLYTIGPSLDGKSAQTTRLFNKCKPEDGSSASALTANKRLLKNRFDTKFVDKLQEVIDEIDFGQAANASPILGTLYKISRDPFFSKAVSKKIIIFSNLMENSQLVSHYSARQMNFEQTSKLSPRLLDVGNSLRGACITVFLISDKNHYNGHTEWWKEYFKHANVATFEIKNI